MQAIELGKTGLRAPRIGFGCGAVMGRVGRKDSLLALATAWEEGIRLFDTARSYGYGEAEAVLGDFLRGRREQAVIATKFGILAARQPGWKRVVKDVARKVLAFAPAAHSILRKGAAGQFSHHQFTIPVLQQSIEESLRALGTEYVDMLFLHAAPASVMEQDDLLEAMGRLVEAGKVRVAGLSSDPEVVMLALAQKTHTLRAMQFPCNVFEFAAVDGLRQGGDCALVANHPFGGVARVQQCRSILRKLAEDRKLDAELREKLGGPEDGVLADVVLNAILCDTGIHVVIPAMMRVEHVRANVRAVSQSRFTAGEIATMRHAIVSGAAQAEGQGTV